MNKISFNTFLSFVVFFLAVSSHFLFDILAPIYLEADFFRLVVGLRANVIIFTPLFVLGLDQSIIRFGGVVKDLFKYYLVISSCVLACCFFLYKQHFIVIDDFFFVLALCIYALGLMFSSLYRISNENHKSQVLINGWRFTLHIIAFLFSSSIISESINAVYLLLFSVSVPLLILVTRSNVNLIDKSKNKEFFSYSAIFMVFLLMLAFSQYYDQLFATKYLNVDKLNSYIFFSAFFIAPCTIISTFVGFVIAPNFAKTKHEDVKAKYWKLIKIICLLYPIFAVLLYLIFIFVSLSLDYKPSYSLSIILAFCFVGFLRLIYSINSSVMGMKSNKMGLLFFFMFCLFGIILQLLILYYFAVEANDEVIGFMLLAVIFNWSLRNAGACYLIQRYF